MSQPQSVGSNSSWLDRKCDEFERDWLAGKQPRIEDSLAGAPADQRAPLLRELIAVELELRQRRGEQIRRVDYSARFPDASAILDEFSRSFAGESEVTHPFTQSGTIPNVVTTSARYRDLREFRRGGLGVLYRGVDDALHRETVVKFMHENCANDPNLTAQFRVEAEITSRLDHPGIVPVYGIGEDWQGSPFYVMRLVKGREFRQAIQEYHAAGGPGRRGTKNRQLLFTLLEHLTSACNTVAYAHHVGIVHCDLKPSNIMIGRYGETFVLDWGLATSFERSTTFFVLNEPTMRPMSATSGSTSGHRGGTYGYISPEQLRADSSLGPTSDVYSLGATLFEVLTGRPPFNSRDNDVADQIQQGTFPRPRQLQPGVAWRLEAICLKAMCLNPNDRYSTAKQLANDISNWMHDEEIEAAPDRWSDRLARLARRHRAVTFALIVLAFASLLGLGWTDRMLKVAAHERELREAQSQKLVAEQLSFTTALDTFEDLCRPLANGEMNNLGVFRPFVEKIKNFTSIYLENFEDVEEMQNSTGRVYELRATVSRVYSTDKSQALQDYQRAEAIYVKLVEGHPDDLDHAARLARIRLSEGRLLFQLDEFDQANNALQLAITELEKMRKQNSDDRAVVRYLAEAYHSVGEVCLSRELTGTAYHQSLLEAEEFFGKSKTLREQLVATSVGEERRNHMRDLARSWGYLGGLYLSQGDIPQAHSAYTKSKEIREELYRSNPLDPEHRFQFARGLRNFGDMEFRYRGDLAGGIDALSKARDLQQDLMRDFPEVISFSADCGGTLNMLAEAYLQQSILVPERKDEFRTLAAQTAEASGAIYGRVFRARSSPRDPSGVHGLALSLVLLSAAKQATDAEESRHLAKQAEETLENLGQESVLPGYELLTLAMARSLQDKPEPAFRALKEGVERGENSALRLERQSELCLASVARDETTGPAFKALLEAMQARLKLE